MTVPDATPQPDDEGFTLEPLETPTGPEKKVKQARKRQLVVDSDKEFTGTDIRALLTDYNDTLQAKCFPPPTKKAMMWKEIASCEQLFNRPTSVTGNSLSLLVSRNYKCELPEGAQVDVNIDLDLDELQGNKDTTTENVEVIRNQTASTVDDLPDQPNIDITQEQTPDEHQIDQPELELPPEQPQLDNLEQEEAGEDPSRVIPDLQLEIPEPSEEQQESNELSEEFEQRRWTKHTQQVIRVLDRGFKSKDSVEFSALTQRCNRKLAASRFYTCLLLAKEKMIKLEQDQPYSEITISKGSKFTEVS